MKSYWGIFTLVATLILPQTTLAILVSFSGSIRKNFIGVYLTLNQNSDEKDSLQSNNRFIQSTLKKLKTGDRLSGVGEINNDKKTVQVTNIDSVGLSRLIGKWRSESEVYEFTSFNTLTITNNDTDEVQKIQYSITPNEEDTSQWIIFISNQQSTELALLDINSDMISLRYLDNENGDIDHTVVLDRDR